MVAHVQGPSWAHSWLEDLLTRLPNDGWSVLAVSLGPEGPFHRSMRAHGLRAVALSAPGRLRYPLASLRLARLLRSVDVVHAHLFDAEVVCTLAGSLARRPVVITRHLSPGSLEILQPSALKRRLHRALDSVLLRRAAAVVAPSNLVVEEVTARGVNPNRIHAIPLGSDIDRLAKVDTARAAALRAELAPGSRYVALSVGRLSREKRVDVVERAWRETARSRPDAMLWIAGDGPERATLESTARDLGIDRSVRFLGWRRDIPELMTAADVVVHASATESTGLVLLEALALARPLVTTPVGIVNEFLADGRDCLVVPHGDPDALARALAALEADPLAAGSRGRAGRVTVERRAAMDPVAKAYAGVYDEVTTVGKRDTERT